jgi:outer membrane protein, heavy metal efflux system
MNGSTTRGETQRIRVFGILVGFSLFCFLFLSGKPCGAEGLVIQDLIDEALKNNPELLASQAGLRATEHKIPQVGALPDPMFMVGYQNEGYNTYNFGDSPDAQWMVSVSQMVPFYGKRGLKAEMASREAETARNRDQALRLKTISRIKELYADLFLAYKNLDILEEKRDLSAQIERAAQSRYASGTAPQQEVVMAQTEKYMILEKEEMSRQKLQAAEAMLNAAVGRDIKSPLGRPESLPVSPWPFTLDELLQQSKTLSPELKSRAEMVQGNEAKVEMAKKEYYPDFTLGANVFKRSGPYNDMWNLTAAVNVPIFFGDKQRQGLREAEALRRQARRELEAAEIMLASSIRENQTMVLSADRLMTLYREGLVPKIQQDFQLSLSGYMTGRIEALTVLSRLKALLDYELLYWGQLAEREKSIARLEALTGTMRIQVREKTDEEK